MFCPTSLNTLTEKGSTFEGRIRRGEVVSETSIGLDEAEALARVIGAVRRKQETSRPEVTRITGFSRTLVSKYIDTTIGLNLLQEGALGVSTGGRAPRLLKFNADAGAILVAELGVSGMSIALSDLRGKLSEIVELDNDIGLGPEKVLLKIESTFKKIITKTKKEIWGIGIGLPGPVEFAAGIPMSPPIMPGWDLYPVRERLSKIFNAPVWVDNDVNLMALGEVAKNHEKKYNELIYIKIGSGIGAGILTHGRLHRGAQGCAGDIGHIAVAGIADVICRCGNVSCLEAVAGGIAIARDALSAVENGKSAYLRDFLKVNKKIEASDVIQGAKSGDKWCVDAINAAGQQVGNILATLVNFHNPSLIVLGGGISNAGDSLLASIRETIFKRSLPLATRDLEIRISTESDTTGLTGAAEMVISELFSPPILKQWVVSGIPELPINYQDSDTNEE
ncbi:sugar kinase [Actinomycetes bacterium]|nr:sugar kinase [Actinomycetes bacterium]